MNGPARRTAATEVDGPPLRSQLRNRLRARGLRWTPQRRLLIDVLDRVDGHVTGAELVEACRELDPGTTPSTVYRTLDVLEEIGVVSHSHGHDGREEYHVRPAAAHGHLVCDRCGGSWELTADEADPIVRSLRKNRNFQVDLGHLTIVGGCAACAALAGPDQTAS
jgi:Fur family transcriptional regulator, ferric uptake regulator